jgi:N-acetylneuraminic acid mutarotase
MPTPRSTGFSLIFKSKIYVFGGYSNDKKRSKTIDIYDPFKNYWEQLNVRLRLFRSKSIGESKQASYSPPNPMRYC